MDTPITYHWGHEELRIDLGNRSDKRLQMMCWLEFAFTVGLATLFLAQALPLRTLLLHWLTIVGASTLYLLAAYRLLSRITLSEQLILTPTHFIIRRRSLVSRKEQRYQWEYMGALHYLGNPEASRRTVWQRGRSGTHSEEDDIFLQQVYREGSLYFTYHSYPVRFGRFVYEWHAEEIVRMMQLYAGDHLQLGSEWHQMLEQHEWDDAAQG